MKIVLPRVYLLLHTLDNWSNLNLGIFYGALNSSHIIRVVQAGK